MTPRAPNLNLLWSTLLIDELVRNGISLFCISPGSRSTPLTVAAARNANARTRVFFDERSAAFFALGHARATGKPAALICTSGTAVANYLPAVIESAQDFVPMILLTADRPPELRDTGANQTIEQTGIFGAYLRWSVDMPCPDAAIPPAFVLTTVDQAVHRALSQPPGPVQINCMFREPLIPGPDEAPPGLPDSLQEWHSHRQPWTQYSIPELTPAPAVIDRVGEKLAAAKKPLLVAGRLDTAEERQAVARLAGHLDVPVFADITSGLRSETASFSLISHYNHMLNPAGAPPEFDCILHLGGRVVCKHLPLLPAKEKILVVPQPGRMDPAHNITLRIQAGIASFCHALEHTIPAAGHSGAGSGLPACDAELQRHFSAALDRGTLTEPAVARCIARTILPGNGLYLGNSMPVRDFDMFVTALPEGLQTAANRGASGIDGTLASAAGFADGLAQPVTLVTGDLALLHDLNSLSLLPGNPNPVIVVVINNHGGGIFSLLPVSQQTDIFDEFFGTPHGFTFEHAAAQFGLGWQQPKGLDELQNMYAAALKQGRSLLIEISGDRQENAALHRALERSARTIIEKTAW